MNDKLFSMISLSKKAGKLLNGFDVVKEAVLSQQAHLVIFSADVSERTKKTMLRVIADCGDIEISVKETPLVMRDYAVICGKPTGVLAITDSGFATAIMKLI